MMMMVTGIHSAPVQVQLQRGHSPPNLRGNLLPEALLLRAELHLPVVKALQLAVNPLPPPHPAKALPVHAPVDDQVHVPALRQEKK